MAENNLDTSRPLTEQERTSSWVGLGWVGGGRHGVEIMYNSVMVEAERSMEEYRDGGLLCIFLEIHRKSNRVEFTRRGCFFFGIQVVTIVCQKNQTRSLRQPRFFPDLVYNRAFIFC